MLLYKADLDSVWVTGLSQDFQKGGVWHEEETGKHKTLLLKISTHKEDTKMISQVEKHKVKVNSTLLSLEL